MYQTLEDLEKIQNDQEIPNKQKKWLKWILIASGASIILTGAGAGLTKVGVIPNWLGIELLCNHISEQGPLEQESLEQGPLEQESSEQGPLEQGPLEQGPLEQESLEQESSEQESSEQESSEQESSEQEPLEQEPLLGKNYTCDSYSCCNEDGLCVYNIHPELMLDKPMIYLYPTKETEVHILLGNPRNLLHTYPKYNSEKGRNVIAQPNGDLKDMDTGRKLYALYREGKSDIETNFDEGFVVAGKDIIPFLEEKLAILGLNEREAEEFIVYWLPQMEDNEYNLIRFETIEEQNKNMPLNITPTPDTIIRVMMDWKPIDELIEIPEQHLTTPERNGFTVVEWGGSPRN